MKLVITDANIFMHLIDSGLQEEFFRLHLEILTTEEVFLEIGDERQILEPFVGNGLTVISSDEDQLESIQTSPFSKGLSFPDRVVLFHAIQRRCTVLTGEKLMTNECKRHGLDVHGILWVLDQLESEGICDHLTLKAKLQDLMNLPDFRVPKAECSDRLNKWSSDPLDPGIE